ncbi:LCP family protein [Candidatus Woesebacteria bacterium]|nr:LCP family protein [Candidatus Woesebacteria bacterium]
MPNVAKTKRTPSSSRQRATIRSPRSSRSSRFPVESRPSGFDSVLLKTLKIASSVIRYGVACFLGGILTLAIVAILFFVFYLRVVAFHGNVPMSHLVKILLSQQSVEVTQTNGQKNILILGTDQLGNRDSSAVLTDTIILMSMGLSDGQITSFSFPRDLYVASHSAKINSLYEKGKTLSPNQPTQVIEQTIEDISGLPVHHVVVLDISTVGKLIDAFGGLDVTIDRSFIDYQFPRTDVDVRVEKDPAKLYEMVAFSNGVEHMNGERALKFIRSRKSADPIEGSDDGRAMRQQKVISALLAKLKDPMLPRNPEQLGKLFALYTTHVEAYLPLSQVMGVARTYAQQRKFPSFVSYQFSVNQGTEPADFFHPRTHPSGAWVYLPVDPTYSSIKRKVQSWIFP